MPRSFIILATTVALLLGSFGLPVSLYSCEMMKAKAPACGVCSCGMSAGRASMKAGSASPGKSCCAKKQSVVRDDVARAMPQSLQLCTQLAAAVIILHHFFADPAPPSPRADHALHHPPPLERHARSTYLFNSTFLI